jgi:hypothetical protein
MNDWEYSYVNTPLNSAIAVTRALLLALLTVPLAAQRADRLTARNVSIAETNFKGRSAVQVIATPRAPDATSFAIVKDAVFRDGTIEVDLAANRPMEHSPARVGSLA